MEKETYCLACRKYTKNTNPKVVRNRQNTLMMQSNCATCNCKKSRFIKKQQAMGISSKLGIKTPLSKVLLLNIVLIYFKKMNTYCLSCQKDTRNIDPKVIKTKNNRKMMLSRCSICNNKKSTFTAEPSASARISKGSGLFDSLGLNTLQNRMKNALWNAFNR